MALEVDRVTCRDAGQPLHGLDQRPAPSQQQVEIRSQGRAPCTNHGPGGAVPSP